MKAKRRFLSLSLAMALGLATLAAAQPLGAQRVNLTPSVGVYIPTTELVKAVSGDEFKQEISLTVGAQLEIWFSDRIGIQGTGSYAPSQLSFSASGASTQEGANIFTGSGRLSLYLIPTSSPISLLLSGGVGVVNRSGAAFQTVENKTDIGGAVGASLGFRLGRILQLRLGADTYIYNSNVLAAAAGPGAARATQRDVQLSFGAGIPLLGLGAGT